MKTVQHNKTNSFQEYSSKWILLVLGYLFLYDLLFSIFIVLLFFLKKRRCLNPTFKLLKKFKSREGSSSDVLSKQIRWRPNF